MYGQTIATRLKIVDPTTFKETSPTIKNDLTDAVGKVITDKITSEICNAIFIAILLYKATELSNKSQLLTVNAI